MKYTIFLIGYFIVLVVSPVLIGDEVTKVGTTAAPFLKVDMGSRAIGMGGAFVAISDDISGMYWNPSGITRINRTQVLFCHTQWIAEISFNYAGIAVPLGGMGTIGISSKFLSTDDLERTTIDQPDGTGEYFSVGSYMVGLTYAADLTDRFSIGGSAKFVQEKIYHSSAQGVAFDVGTLFTTQFKDLTIGMSITNYGTKMRMGGRDMLMQVDVDELVSGNNDNINANLKTDAFELPLMFRVGIALDILKGISNSNLTLAADVLHPNDDVESLNLGGEYIFNHIFCLRAGYKALFASDTQGGFSFGFGLRSKLFGSSGLHLDYGYLDFGILKEVQMFTIILDL